MKFATLKILLLSSDPQRVQAIKQQCFEQALSCIFILVKDPADFLEKLSWTTPDLMICDASMLAATQEIFLPELNTRFPELPVVFVTDVETKETSSAKSVWPRIRNYISSTALEHLAELITNFMEGDSRLPPVISPASLQDHTVRVLLHKVDTLIEQGHQTKDKSILVATLQQISQLLAI